MENQNKIFLSFYEPNILRVVFTDGDAPQKPSFLVENAPEHERQFACAQLGNSCGLSSRRITVSAFRDTVTWRSQGKQLPNLKFALERRDRIVYDTAGEKPVITRRKTVDGERTWIENLRPRTDGTVCRGTVTMDLTSGSPLFGLGQGEDGIYNRRESTFYLYQHNMRIPVPILLSPDGWAMFVDCQCLMKLEDSVLTVDAVEQLQVYLIAGTPEECIASIRTLTGQTAMLPKWAMGFFQSREAYHTQEELVEVAQRYRDAHLPIDCVVQDWNTWVSGCWGEKKLDAERYPDMPGTAKRLHEQNVHTIVSVWPNMAGCSENYKELEDKGQILADCSTYNAFSPEARDTFWKQMSRGLYQQGFDGWWCDSSEPFSGPDWKGEERLPEDVRYEIVGSEHKKYLGEDRANSYSVYHALAVYEGQRKEDSDHRVVNLTRSGWASSQKYGTILWSGDICARWDVLRRQIPEALNVSMSGLAYWTFDAGGFFVVNTAWQKRGCGCNTDPEPKWFWKGGYNDGVEDPAYRELFLRWLQLGCFMPVFRTHGTDTPREIWNFGKPGSPDYEAYADTLRLRYTLMPYIYSVAGSVTQSGKTFLRPIFFDFPADENAYSSSQFFFGPSLLVCPILEPMFYDVGGVPLDKPGTARCQLPAGCDWYDWYTGMRFEGGTEVTADAPLNRIPFFVKAGSVIPTAEGLEYASQKPESPICLHIYPGADGGMEYYDDAGDGFGYENGEYRKFFISWDDEAGILTLGSGEGSMAAQEQFFTAILAGKKTEIRYCGEKVSISLR